ncbi:MAG: hypothetical protein PWR13_1080 [Archaeoglobi archaeon]|nr:hypothetical protein [Archaeoglobi archaeon]
MSKIIVLKAILEKPGATYNDIISLTGLSHQSVAKTIKELESEDLILHDIGEDRRKKHYRINPNQLIMVRWDKVIDHIREKLGESGIELAGEEERPLREFLLKYLRPEIERKLLEMDEGEARDFSPIEYIITILVGVVNLNELVNEIQKKMAEKEIEEDLVETTTEVARDLLGEEYASRLEWLRDIPKTFVKKFSETEYYRNHLLTKFFNQIREILLNIVESDLKEE